MSKVFNYEAYGSIMLLGEHVVLYQGFGLCCPINRSIVAQLEFCDDQQVRLSSDLGSYEASLATMVDDRQLQYCVQAIKTVLPMITKGFHIQYRSTLEAKIGLGSSAASVVATLGVLHLAFLGTVQNDLLFAQAVETVRRVQGRASCCDCAASVYKTTVAFNPRTQEKKLFYHSFALTVLYCGYKVQTNVMLEFVEKRFSNDPQAVQKIFTALDHLTQLGIEALEHNDLARLGEIMTSAHQHLKELGVSNQDLELLISILQKNRSILGSKLSGAGGGDCVIGLGTAAVSLPVTLEQAKVLSLETVSGSV